jgi:hypothetical protein
MDQPETFALECHSQQISYLFLVFDEQHDTSVGHQHLARVGPEARRFVFEIRKKPVN